MMEVIPAIDLRRAKVVRLWQGNYDIQTTYSDDPLGVALNFQKAGAPRLHVVDLDGAAAGRPINLDVISRIVEMLDIPVQMGGGIRNLSMVDKVFGMGVSRIVFGTAAVEDSELVRQAIAKHGSQAVVVGVDAMDGVVAVRAWKEKSSVTAIELVKCMRELGVLRFIYTDITRDGTMSEPNFEAIQVVANVTDAAIVASGGVSSISHLKLLDKIGVEGAIIGSAIYKGTIDLRKAIDALEG